MKNDTVMGIIGNTHGVKIDARPSPNAVNRNAPNPSGAAGALVSTVPDDGAGAAAASLYSVNPAGATNALVAGAAASTVNVNVAVFFFGGRHMVSLQAA